MSRTAGRHWGGSAPPASGLQRGTVTDVPCGFPLGEERNAPRTLCRDFFDSLSARQPLSAWFVVTGRSGCVALNRRTSPIIVQQIEHCSFQARSTAIIGSAQFSNPVQLATDRPTR